MCSARCGQVIGTINYDFIVCLPVYCRPTVVYCAFFIVIFVLIRIFGGQKKHSDIQVPVILPKLHTTDEIKRIKSNILPYINQSNNDIQYLCRHLTLWTFTEVMFNNHPTCI